MHYGGVPDRQQHSTWVKLGQPYYLNTQALNLWDYHNKWSKLHTTITPIITSSCKGVHTHYQKAQAIHPVHMPLQKHACTYSFTYEHVSIHADTTFVWLCIACNYMDRTLNNLHRKSLKTS